MSEREAATDEREELRRLTSAVGAWLEVARASGAVGVPRSAARRSAASGEPTAAPAVPSARAEVAAPAAALPQRAAAKPVTRVSPPPVSAAPGAAPPALSDRGQGLQALEGEVAACSGCGLASTRTQTVFARGSGSAGLCFVGEGPGADEDATGSPFVGAAGQLLDRMITGMGLDRDEVYVCNIVKCRPPGNRKPEPAEIAACRGFLERQLALVQPAVIVALGATAVHGLLGTGESITRIRGNWKLYQGRIAVMPTFHPAYLLRTPSAKRAVWDDLQAVLRQLGRPVPERKA
ncbi:MAG: uracil-DNA glycosylase [Polyangiaceae bacterium]|nr:uracil-DNA glycosylase [Polyangiaceae bacterium]